MIQWMLRNTSWSLAIVLIEFCGQIALADEGVPAKVVSVSTDHTTVLQEVNGSKKWSLSGPEAAPENTGQGVPFG